MGRNGWGILENPTQKENSNSEVGSTPVRVLGYRTRL
ncbi:MAG: hypothetical protein ACD_38C00186G0012 [uncultured bacterium]|nr:MAG: hypothetical protein ACD_38C00186G0012 [uncultured bacterium]